jgi:hypothetical protein
MARAAPRRGERHDSCCGCPANRISNWIGVWLRYSRADLGPSSRGIPQTTPRAIRLLTNEMPAAGALHLPAVRWQQAGLRERKGQQ